MKLIREIPGPLIHQHRQALGETEAMEQLNHVLALVDQVMQTDNLREDQPELNDLDPRPGYILLRHENEEVDAHYEDGALECQLRRFNPDVGLVRHEVLRARTEEETVEVYRHVWRYETGETWDYYYVDRLNMKKSYRKSLP